MCGAVLLALPVSAQSGETSGFVEALFTSVSALCVTGLIVVDTPEHWSTFGEVVILGLIQLGGIGIMTTASLLGLLVSRRFGLRMRLTAQAETKALDLGDVRRVVRGVITVSLLLELVIATLLAVRFATGYGYEAGRAAYHGVFHAISAFNNAGFALYSDSLMGFATDAWICLPVMFAMLAGGLGFPVWLELWRHRRPRRRGDEVRRWSMHAKLTLLTTSVLLGIGASSSRSRSGTTRRRSAASASRANSLRGRSTARCRGRPGSTASTSARWNRGRCLSTTS